MIQVGILGAAGLSGQELLQRLAGHPEAEVRVATSTKFQHQGIHEVFSFLPESPLTFSGHDADLSTRWLRPSPVATRLPVTQAKADYA
mgnify:CR=1 FL=1